MTEKPILFSGPMVRAILDGRKVQTRRVIKRRGGDAYPGRRWWVGVHPGGGWWALDDPAGPSDTYSPSANCGFLCPFPVGTRLWVRETWCHKWDMERDHWTDPPVALYRADGQEVVHVDGADKSPWRPSIHMPRWASRLTLEVTEVRVQRLQDISEEDAIAEGAMCIDWPDENIVRPYMLKLGLFADHATPWFALLWDSIYGRKPGCSWTDSPWVWTVAFKRVKP